MRTQDCSFLPFSNAFSSVCTHTQDNLTRLFKCTTGPLIGSVLKVCLYREAYLKGRMSRWVILPLVKNIGNIWFRVQGLPPQFTTFDQRRLKKTENELLEIGQKETVSFDQRSITFVHFKAPNSVNASCVLYLNGFGLPYQTAKKFIHRHMDAGFDFAVFEWGNKVSIDGFIEDAEAAYQFLLEKGYRPDQIKILGYCGTSYIAAHMKLNHHAEGVDAILINPHTSFRDVVAKSNRIGLLGLNSILTDEYDFNNEKTLRNLSGGSASTCIIIDPQNSITPEDIVERLEDSLQQSKFTTIKITEKFNKQFENPSVWGSYVRFLQDGS